MRITIRPSKTITVTFPWYVSYSEAIRFVQEKTGWIEQSLAKMEVSHPPSRFMPGREFRTFAHEMCFVTIDKGEPFIKVDKSRITVFHEESTSFQDTHVQEFIQQAVDRVLRNEARQYLPARVEFFAAKHKLAYTQVSVKKMRTRWGSCSTSGKINLNIHLMRLPAHLIDYVILHELAHTKHHNHSKQFWEYLEALCPHSKEYAKEMKKYRTTVY